MTKSNKFFFWMILVAVGSLILHYLILWTTKNNEGLFFLIAFGTAAAAITSWIFDKINQRRNR